MTKDYEISFDFEDDGPRDLDELWTMTFVSVLASPGHLGDEFNRARIAWHRANVAVESFKVYAEGGTVEDLDEKLGDVFDGTLPRD